MPAAMRCQKRRKDRSEAAYVTPTGMERKRMKVRSLASVKMVG